MANKLKHAFNHRRVCECCGVPLKQAMNSANNSGFEDVVLEFHGGVEDGGTMTVQFVEGVLASGDKWIVRREHATGPASLYRYGMREMPRTACGVRMFYCTFEDLEKEGRS
jgi:hypothetical protein